MCFLFCLVKIRTRKLALFQDPECERCTADKNIFGLNLNVPSDSHDGDDCKFLIISLSPKTIILSWSSFPVSCTKKEWNSSGTSKFRLAGPGKWIKSFFCLTRRKTLKRLTLEVSVICVAYWSVTSSNADATETAGVETSLKSFIFLDTFLAPTFPKQISWLWFPRIEISCSPLVIADVRQLSVWYWAQFQVVVNLFSLFL